MVTSVSRPAYLHKQVVQINAPLNIFITSPDGPQKQSSNSCAATQEHPECHTEGIYGPSETRLVHCPELALLRLAKQTQRLWRYEQPALHLPGSRRVGLQPGQAGGCGLCHHNAPDEVNCLLHLDPVACVCSIYMYTAAANWTIHAHTDNTKHENNMSCSHWQAAPTICNVCRIMIMVSM